jgi:bile acid:Na+ symporter, BASS family
MPIGKLINVLVIVTLIQLMVTIGPGVTIRGVVAVAISWRLAAGAAIANYILVPACAWGPVVDIPISRPGRSRHPDRGGVSRRLTDRLSSDWPKGDIPAAVGLMALLAGPSAIVAPLLLGLALPLVAGDQRQTINVVKMDEYLLLMLLIPLAVGIAVKAWRPKLTDWLIKPSRRLSLALNILTLGAIVTVQLSLLLAIKPAGYAGMLALTLAGVAFGWLMGGPDEGQRVAMAFSTGLRNVGVSHRYRELPGGRRRSPRLWPSPYSKRLLSRFSASCGGDGDMLQSERCRRLTNGLGSERLKPAPGWWRELA